MWEKAKKIGLFCEKFKKIAFILIFAMKFSHILLQNKTEYIEAMENFINNLEIKEKYVTFFKYFKQNWSITNFLKFEE